MKLIKESFKSVWVWIWKEFGCLHICSKIWC